MQINSINDLPPKYRRQAEEKLGEKPKIEPKIPTPLPRRKGEVTIIGRPQPKGRPRLSKGGKTYTPKKTKDAEKQVKNTWINKYGDKQLSGPLRVTICAAFLVPKNKSKKERERLLEEKYRIGAPDLDNIAKLVLDGLNGVAYEDDRSIVEITAFKIYDEYEYVYVRVEEI